VITGRLDTDPEIKVPPDPKILPPAAERALVEAEQRRRNGPAQNDPGAEIADRVIKFLLHSRAAQLWYVFPATGLVLTSESPCRGGSSSHLSQP
jgi:hypothetical protein